VLPASQPIIRAPSEIALSSDSARNPDPSMPVAETNGNFIAAVLASFCVPQDTATRTGETGPVLPSAARPGGMRQGNLVIGNITMTNDRQPLRSFLFAPGSHARRVEKALSLDADAVILRTPRSGVAAAWAKACGVS
jgi:hypothetical protein